MATETVPEVMEAGLSFAPTFTPATITADFATMRKRLDELMVPFADMDDSALANMQLKELRACRSEVNAIIRNVEDGRKAVKREYMKAYEAFEQEVKNLLEPARKAEAQIGDMVNQKDAIERDLRREGLERTYEDFAPALVPVVPFERILESKWLNRSTKAAKAAEELQDKVAKIAADWDSLKAQKDMPLYAETERRFFQTLDLGEALRWQKDQLEEQARIDAMKAEISAYQAEVEPEPTPEQNPPAETQPEPSTSTYVLTLEMTEGQFESMRGFIKQLGIKGSFRRVSKEG